MVGFLSSDRWWLLYQVHTKQTTHSAQGYGAVVPMGLGQCTQCHSVQPLPHFPLLQETLWVLEITFGLHSLNKHLKVKYLTQGNYFRN